MSDKDLPSSFRDPSGFLFFRDGLIYRQANIVIHHLAISNNLPFNKIAHLLSKICNSLIIEFVPKSDSQVQKLLSTREDIFPDYTQQTFESEFRKYFRIQKSVKIKESEKILYLMERR